MMSVEYPMTDFTFEDLGLEELIDTNTLFPEQMSLKKSPGHESVASEMYSVDGESLQSATEDLRLADVDFSALMDDEANNTLLPLLPVPEESMAGVEDQMINVASPGTSSTTDAVSETAVSAQVLLEQMSEGRITPRSPSPPVSVKVVHHVTDTKRASSSRSSKGKKQVEMPDSEQLDRNRKNAIQAKINREKKKQQMKSLEDDVKNLTKDNEELKSRNQQLDEEKKSLEEEVAYLKSVLANQSTLSQLLQNIDNVQGVSLTTSFTASRKRSMDHDHDYHERPAKRGRTSARSQVKSDSKTSGGVCLHVAKDKVSMEFCSSCAKMATGGKRPRPSP